MAAGLLAGTARLAQGLPFMAPEVVRLAKHNGWAKQRVPNPPVDFQLYQLECFLLSHTWRLIAPGRGLDQFIPNPPPVEKGIYVLNAIVMPTPNPGARPRFGVRVFRVFRGFPLFSFLPSIFLPIPPGPPVTFLPPIPGDPELIGVNRS